MSLMEKLRELRTKAGITQRELALAAGVTSGFIAQIEMGDRVPSFDVLLRLLTALQLKRAEQEELVVLYEQAQQEKLQRAVRTRGAAVRSVLRTRGGPSGVGSRAGREGGESEAEQIAREVSISPDLLKAYRNLKIALADPAMRETVLKAIEAFARAARKEPKE